MTHIEALRDIARIVGVFEFGAPEDIVRAVRELADREFNVPRLRTGHQTDHPAAWRHGGRG